MEDSKPGAWMSYESKIVVRPWVAPWPSSNPAPLMMWEPFHELKSSDVRKSSIQEFQAQLGS